MCWTFDRRRRGRAAWTRSTLVADLPAAVTPSVAAQPA